MDQRPQPSSLRVHQFAGVKPGPKLLVLGAVHGNEVCGTLAMGRLIGELDMMIAAQALSVGAVLVTNSTRHFERIEAPLMLANWREDGA